MSQMIQKLQITSTSILISKESIIILEVMQLIICVNFFAICKNTEWILSKKTRKTLKKDS